MRIFQLISYSLAIAHTGLYHALYSLSSKTAVSGEAGISLRKLLISLVDVKGVGHCKHGQAKKSFDKDMYLNAASGHGQAPQILGILEFHESL